MPTRRRSRRSDDAAQLADVVAEHLDAARVARDLAERRRDQARRPDAGGADDQHDLAAVTARFASVTSGARPPGWSRRTSTSSIIALDRYAPRSSEAKKRRTRPTDPRGFSYDCDMRRAWMLALALAACRAARHRAARRRARTRASTITTCASAAIERRGADRRQARRGELLAKGKDAGLSGPAGPPGPTRSRSGQPGRRVPAASVRPVPRVRAARRAIPGRLGPERAAGHPGPAGPAGPAGSAGHARRRRVRPVRPPRTATRPTSCARNRASPSARAWSRPWSRAAIARSICSSPAAATPIRSGWRSSSPRARWR